MYKLIVNNLQVGNYSSLRDMMKSALVYGGGKTMKEINWKGKNCHLWFFD